MTSLNHHLCLLSLLFLSTSLCKCLPFSFSSLPHFLSPSSAVPFSPPWPSPSPFSPQNFGEPHRHSLTFLSLWGGDSLGHSFCHLGSSFLFSNILVLKSHCPTETLISSQVGVGDMILCIKDITRAEAPKKEVRLRQGDGRPFIARNG